MRPGLHVLLRGRAGFISIRIQSWKTCTILQNSVRQCHCKEGLLLAKVNQTDSVEVRRAQSSAFHSKAFASPSFRPAAKQVYNLNEPARRNDQRTCLAMDLQAWQGEPLAQKF